ncbi:6-phosphogluconate dehydrogenase-like protein [Rhizobium sp. CF142]|nr:6-phosphogluconate dehydrogenase-like protein [Rhizobium sp. CF142]
MQDMKTATVVGFSFMGWGAAPSLLRVGFVVHGCDVNADVLRRFAEMGGNARANPAAAIIFVFVVNSTQAEKVLFGSQGARETTASGSVVLPWGPSRRRAYCRDRRSNEARGHGRHRSMDALRRLARFGRLVLDVRNRGEHIVSGDYTARSAVDIFVKDLGIVTSEAEKTGVVTPLAAAKVLARKSGVALPGMEGRR